MKKWLTGITLFIAHILFSATALAEDPVYTGIFSNKALDGYDTVAFFTQNKPVKGKKDFKHEYMGADWYFSSQTNLDQFKANPTQYAPQYGGYCAWAVAAKNDFAPGDPMHWSIVDGKLYLNYNRSVQSRWEKDIAGFIAQGDKNWPMLFVKN